MLAQSPQLNERPLDLQEDDSTGRSILIGIGCTLLFHLLLVLLSPQFSFNRFSGVHSGINVTHNKPGKSFDFELAQPVTPPEEKNPFKYVETNPDAPENTPDKTANFSNRNQQSAQPDPAKVKDAENRPSVKGQDKIINDSAIVAGDMSKPQNGGARTPDEAQKDTSNQEEQKARAAQIPLSGFEKVEGKSEDGIAMNVAKSNTPTNHADKEFEGAANATDPNGALVATPHLSRAVPKQRPRLTAAMPSILTTRTSGSTNAGILGRDARWSEYGEYLHEMEEIIVQQWYRILEESRVSPPHGSHVTITFKINSKGETDIIKVEDADSGKQGVWSCQNAIQARQPYRKWSDQMIAVLGDDQTLTFGFYYQ